MSITYAQVGARLRHYSGTAYHYTGASALRGLLTGHQVWASSYEMLNDSLEIRHGVEEVLKALKTWVPGPMSGKANEQALRDYAKTLERVFAELPIYIVSASKDPQLVNQYQGYAGGSGFAVGLASTGALRPFDVGDDPQIWSSGGWLEVFYTAKDKEQYAHETFDQLAASNAVTALVGPMAGMGWVLENAFAALISVLKHESFIAEQEVRYVVTYRGRPHFRDEDRGIIPFLRLGNHAHPLTVKEPGASLELDDIYVGPPSATARRRVRAVELLRQKDYPGVDVKDSKLPYVAN